MLNYSELEYLIQTLTTHLYGTHMSVNAIRPKPEFLLPLIEKLQIELSVTPRSFYTGKLDELA